MPNEKGPFPWAVFPGSWTDNCDKCGQPFQEGQYYTGDQLLDWHYDCENPDAVPTQDELDGKEVTNG